MESSSLSEETILKETAASLHEYMNALVHLGYFNGAVLVAQNDRVSIIAAAYREGMQDD
ncbi:hypothetical protein ACFQ88_09600 [Paenibacillus sp. NPDC056579]|uniref:hypothetical protein n=1 Tax=Paenibacillus sp. NPDC056579 TaxID=3345871 RepID=UPI0036A18EB1